jgi:hypothetical protein
MVKKQEVKEKNASKNLGILSIVLGIFVPLIGIILGIIGLSIPKSEKNYGRDIALNVIGLVISFVMWSIYFLVLFA